jgi:pyruvate dehydrogenase E2 component (dihydrolipoamide acetyltransferase)
VAAIPLPGGGARISPAARKAAAERGVDLAHVRGTGPAGAITLGDVEGAAKQAAMPHRGLDLGKMREAIAAAMAHSKKEIPHYYLATEIAFAAAQDWLERANASRAPQTRLLPAVLLVKAVALAAKKFPAFNGWHGAEGYLPNSNIHVGMAVAIRGGGLVAPALHDCDQRSLDDLMGALRDLVARARVGRLRSSEIADATITVSSLGERGVEQLFGVIYPPQVALVGFGRVIRRPVVSGDTVKAAPVMTATLAGDHRVSDGHSGALFLNEIGRLLQEPDHL